MVADSPGPYDAESRSSVIDRPSRVAGHRTIYQHVTAHKGNFRHPTMVIAPDNEPGDWWLHTSDEPNRPPIPICHDRFLRLSRAIDQAPELVCQRTVTGHILRAHGVRPCPSDGRGSIDEPAVKQRRGIDVLRIHQHRQPLHRGEDHRLFP